MLFFFFFLKKKTSTQSELFCPLQTFMSPLCRTGAPRCCTCSLMFSQLVRCVWENQTHRPFKAQTARLCLFTEALHCLPPSFCSFAYFMRSADSLTADIAPFSGRPTSPRNSVWLQLSAEIKRSCWEWVSRPVSFSFSVSSLFLMMCKAVNQVKYGGVCCDLINYMQVS